MTEFPRSMTITMNSMSSAVFCFFLFGGEQLCKPFACFTTCVSHFPSIRQSLKMLASNSTKYQLINHLIIIDISLYAGIHGCYQKRKQNKAKKQTNKQTNKSITNVILYAPCHNETRINEDDIL